MKEAKGVYELQKSTRDGRRSQQSTIFTFTPHFEQLNMRENKEESGADLKYCE